MHAGPRLERYMLAQRPAAADYSCVLHARTRVRARQAAQTICACSADPEVPEPREAGGEAAPAGEADNGACDTSPDPYRRALGIDFGFRKTGVAVSVGGLAPRPLAVLRLAGNTQQLLTALRDTARRECVTELVVGRSRKFDPVTGEFVVTQQAERSRLFAQRLADCVAGDCMRVWLVDEFGTSKEAERHLKALGVSPTARRRSVSSEEDAVAAALILDNYFRMCEQPAGGSSRSASWEEPKLVRPSARAARASARRDARVDVAETEVAAPLRWLEGDAPPRRPALRPAYEAPPTAPDKPPAGRKAPPLHLLRRVQSLQTRQQRWSEEGL